MPDAVNVTLWLLVQLPCAQWQQDPCMHACAKVNIQHGMMPLSPFPNIIMGDSITAYSTRG